MTIHDGSHNALADVEVTGDWSEPTIVGGPERDPFPCTTESNGACAEMDSGQLAEATASITFTVNDVTDPAVPTPMTATRTTTPTEIALAPASPSPSHPSLWLCILMRYVHRTPI